MRSAVNAASDATLSDPITDVRRARDQGARRFRRGEPGVEPHAESRELGLDAIENLAMVAAAENCIEIGHVEGVEWSKREQGATTATGSLDGVSFDSSGR